MPNLETQSQNKKFFILTFVQWLLFLFLKLLLNSQNGLLKVNLKVIGFLFFVLQLFVIFGDHLKKIGHDVIEYDIVNSSDQDLRIKNVEFSNIVENSDFVFFLAFDVGGSRYLKKYQHTYEFINNNTKLSHCFFLSGF